MKQNHERRLGELERVSAPPALMRVIIADEDERLPGDIDPEAEDVMVIRLVSGEARHD